ncbi:response regulator [Echinicola vietnamensis]|uniref:response regulator n=1 Tax=Echinicola vietnamensis TaxID=390884 RepID=UPI0002E9396C|nr:response regulator [Echinicola vietnamensis]
MAKILILEKDQSLSDNMQEILELEGHELKEIDSVNDLKDGFCAFKPDLFILSAFLERYASGPELVNLLRKYHQIPVMFVSDVYSQVRFEAEIEAISNTIILKKPFKAKTLVQKVKEALVLAGKSV